MNIVQIVADNWETFASAIGGVGVLLALYTQALTIWKLRLEIEKLRKAIADPDPKIKVATAEEMRREIESRRKKWEQERNQMRGFDGAGLAMLAAAVLANLPILIYILLAGLVLSVGLAWLHMRFARTQKALLESLAGLATADTAPP